MSFWDIGELTSCSWNEMFPAPRFSFDIFCLLWFDTFSEHIFWGRGGCLLWLLWIISCVLLHVVFVFLSSTANQISPWGTIKIWTELNSTFTTLFLLVSFNFFSVSRRSLGLFFYTSTSFGTQLKNSYFKCTHNLEENLPHFVLSSSLGKTGRLLWLL